MTNDTAAGAPHARPRDRGQTRQRMRALAAELTAAGLTVHLYDTHAGLDITAIATGPDGSNSNIAVIIDDEGRTQIRYWDDPAAAPAQASAVITRILAVITTASRP